MNRFLDRLPESKYTPTYKINFILVSGVDNQNKESTGMLTVSFHECKCFIHATSVVFACRSR